MTTIQDLPQVKGVKNIPVEDFYTSGHRTCQGCESALVMRLMIKAAGPRSIVLGSTGCMYVANTTYYSTPWVVPWMHTQLGSSGSAATGTAAKSMINMVGRTFFLVTPQFLVRCLLIVAMLVGATESGDLRRR